MIIPKYFVKKMVLSWNEKLVLVAFCNSVEFILYTCQMYFLSLIEHLFVTAEYSYHILYLKQHEMGI